MEDRAGKAYALSTLAASSYQEQPRRSCLRPLHMPLDCKRSSLRGHPSHGAITRQHLLTCNTKVNVVAWSQASTIVQRKRRLAALIGKKAARHAGQRAGETSRRSLVLQQQIKETMPEADRFCSRRR
jgi:hypothetical protein